MNLPDLSPFFLLFFKVKEFVDGKILKNLIKFLKISQKKKLSNKICHHPHVHTGLAQKLKIASFKSS